MVVAWPSSSVVPAEDNPSSWPPHQKMTSYSLAGGEHKFRSWKASSALRTPPSLASSLLSAAEHSTSYLQPRKFALSGVPPSHLRPAEPDWHWCSCCHAPSILSLCSRASPCPSASSTSSSALQRSSCSASSSWRGAEEEVEEVLGPMQVALHPVRGSSCRLIRDAAGPRFRSSYKGEIASTSEGNFQYIGEASAPRSFTRVLPTIKSSQKAPVPTNPTPHYRANPAERGGSPAIGDKDDLGAFWELLDNDLKPLKPLPNVPSSREVFEQHKKLAHEILVEQENIVYLEQKKAELVSQLGKQDKSHKSSQQRYNEKITQLQNKNEGLRGYQLRLSQQLNEIKRKRQACQQQTCPPQHHPSPQANPHTYHHLPQQPPSNLPNPASYQQQHHLYYHQPHQNLPSQHPPHDLPHQHTNHLCCDPHCQARASNPHQNRPQHSSMYPHLQKQ